MKKRLLTVAFLMGALGAYSQVGIGTTNPNKSSQLEVVAKDKGILIPQIALKSSTDKTTITHGNITSLLVWNTNTIADITPGYYYWYESKWMRILDADAFSKLDSNTKNTSLTVQGDKLVLTDTDGKTVDIPLDLINIPTILVKNPNGTYTYTNETGATVIIDATDNVINNFKTIVNNKDVLNELIEVLGDTYVGGNVYYDGVKFTYIDESGNSHVINFKDIVKANETITKLVNNNDGTYTYTNELGDKVTIDVPSDVINNFEDIISNTEVLNQLITHLTNTKVGGNVSYDGDKFTYVDENNVVKNITFKEIVKANETLTVLKYNEVTNILTYKDEDGIDTVIDLNIGAITYDSKENRITYLDGNGKSTPLTLNHTSLVYNKETKVLTYTDSKGIPHVIDLGALVAAHERVTKLVNNADGTYTYFNEAEIDAAGNPIAGTGVTIDIPASVIQNFEDIINNTDVKNELFKTIHNSYVGGNVYYDGAKFTYVTETGETKEITFKELVKANETVTKLVTNTDGTYTYFNETEIDTAGNPIAGTGVTIDIPASVIQNFEDIINNTDVKNELFKTIHNSYVGGNVYYDGAKFTYVTETGETKEITFKELVKANETITNLVANANGTFTYYNEEAYAADGSLKPGAVGTIIDPSLVNVTKVENKYVFKNSKGDIIAELEYNAGDIVYNDNITNLGVTNVQEAIEKLLTKIVEVEGSKGDLLLEADVLEFLDGSTGSDKLLADVKIGIADSGITSEKIANSNVTAEKLTAGSGTEGRIGVANAAGDITYQNLETTVQANQKTVILQNGINTTVESASDLTNTNQTNWKVNVETAKGATDKDVASLGLVKEAALNPTVAVSQTGELSVDLSNLNAIKEVSADYTALITDAILLGDASSSNITITLPTAQGNKGKKFTVKKQDANEDFYVNVSGSINGHTELYTALPHSGWDLVSDGTTWKIINKF